MDIEETASYWKHAYDLELAHSKQAEEEIRRLREGIEEVIHYQTLYPGSNISYLAKEKLKKLLEPAL